LQVSFSGKWRGAHSARSRLVTGRRLSLDTSSLASPIPDDEHDTGLPAVHAQRPTTQL